eukprot:517775-Rhodomonas_salina.2
MAAKARYVTAVRSERSNRMQPKSKTESRVCIQIVPGPQSNAIDFAAHVTDLGGLVGLRVDEYLRLVAA